MKNITLPTPILFLKNVIFSALLAVSLVLFLLLSFVTFSALMPSAFANTTVVKTLDVSKENYVLEEVDLTSAPVDTSSDLNDSVLPNSPTKPKEIAGLICKSNGFERALKYTHESTGIRLSPDMDTRIWRHVDGGKIVPPPTPVLPLSKDELFQLNTSYKKWVSKDDSFGVISMHPVVASFHFSDGSQKVVSNLDEVKLNYKSLEWQGFSMVNHAVTKKFSQVTCEGNSFKATSMAGRN